MGCQRAPDEPAPPARTATASTANAPLGVTATKEAKRARCQLPTPDAPPAPVAKGPAPGCPKDPDGPPKLKHVTLTFPSATFGPLDAVVELAASPDQTERGLMYRTQMPDQTGMLFRLGERREQTFWMHNTCIPLDMFFIDDDGFIVGILENVPTLNDEPRSVGCASSWVLEMNAGWARQHGVRAGQKLVLPSAAR